MVLIALTVAGNLFLTAVIVVIILPYCRLHWQRRQSRGRVPTAGEIWIQDGSLLYAESVGPIGVEIVAVDEQTKSVSKWCDSWDEWRKRLLINGAYSSGQSKPLTMPP